MIKGLYNASISLHEKMRNIQVVANNLANINTNGYKREIPFSEYMKRSENQDIKQVTDFTEGEFQETGNSFDLALSGDAFFAVSTDRGTELTKNGQLKIDEEGFLSTKNGDRVLGNSGEISLNEILIDSKDGITITTDGEIKSGDLVLDKIRMLKVEDPRKLLRSENQKYYDVDENYETAEKSDYQIHQGFIETSNTNPIIEMQAMIQLQKDYEASQKMIASLDNMLGQNKEIGRV
ncbi:MAG: flagellar hook-basal body protein [Melioribacteraceae bacterium]